MIGSVPPKPDSPPSQRLLTGHFQRGTDYHHRRALGIYDWLLIYTVSGAGKFEHPGGSFVAGPGVAVLMEPDVAHSYGTDVSTGNWELLWAHFEPSPAWRAWMDWPVAGPGMRRIEIADAEAREHVALQLREAHRCCTQLAHHGLELGLNALEAALLWCDRQNPASNFARLDERLRAALDLLMRCLHEPLSIPRLAQAAHLSPSRFAHLFRAQLKTTPQQFIEGQRLTRARQLLESTDLRVSEVAAAVGFANPFYFTLRFKRTYGASPAAYRQRIERRGEPAPAAL